jgi:hypothetical protein
MTDGPHPPSTSLLEPGADARGPLGRYPAGPSALSAENPLLQLHPRQRRRSRPPGRVPAGTGERAWVANSRCRAGRQRMASWSSARVVKTTICHGQHRQEAEVEQQHQRRLLGLADGDVHSEQADQRCDPEHDAHPPDMFQARWAPSMNRPMVNVTSPPSARRASPCRCLPPEGRKDPYLCRSPVP